MPVSLVRPESVATVIVRIDETPWEGSERTKTIFSFRACGADAAAPVGAGLAGACQQKAAGAIERKGIRANKKIIDLRDMAGSSGWEW
jgi:hypothetical protein